VVAQQALVKHVLITQAAVVLVAFIQAQLH
jgi:hypothetical protein